MSVQNDAVLLAAMGEAIEDPAEETFILFSQDLPSNDLGMIDPKASEVVVDVKGCDYSITQSSGLLQSARAAGTTGAAVWKVTPRVAQWLASEDSLLWKKGLLCRSKNILELGCGVAGIIGMAVSHLVSSYTLTDQGYVMKLLNENIKGNRLQVSKGHRGVKGNYTCLKGSFDNLYTAPLDWEHDSAQNLRKVLPSERKIDVVIVCDCVYNSFLIEPLTQTCVDICKMDPAKSTTIIIAQQLRTNDIFEEWLTRFLVDFEVWRLKDNLLPSNLQSSSGYVIHLALLRSNESDDNIAYNRCC